MYLSRLPNRLSIFGNLTKLDPLTDAFEFGLRIKNLKILLVGFKRLRVFIGFKIIKFEIISKIN